MPKRLEPRQVQVTDFLYGSMSLFWGDTLSHLVSNATTQLVPCLSSYINPINTRPCAYETFTVFLSPIAKWALTHLLGVVAHARWAILGDEDGLLPQQLLQFLELFIDFWAFRLCINGFIIVLGALYPHRLHVSLLVGEPPLEGQVLHFGHI